MNDEIRNAHGCSRRPSRWNASDASIIACDQDTRGLETSRTQVGRPSESGMTIEGQVFVDRGNSRRPNIRRPLRRVWSIPTGRRRPRTTQDGWCRTGAGNVAALRRPVEVITAMARSVSTRPRSSRAAKPDKRQSTGVYGRLPLRPRTVRALDLVRSIYEAAAAVIPAPRAPGEEGGHSRTGAFAGAVDCGLRGREIHVVRILHRAQRRP